MAYTPISPEIFNSAFSGCLAGIISGRVISSTVAIVYDHETKVAGAFAEELDTVLNDPAPTDAEIKAVQGLSSEIWNSRFPTGLPSETAVNHVAICNAVRALLIQLNAYYAASVTPGSAVSGTTYAHYFDSVTLGAPTLDKMLAASVALLANFKNGDKVWVYTFANAWIWRPDITLAVSDNVNACRPTVIGFGSPGCFIRDKSDESVLWAAQGTYFVDPLHASTSDENPGSAAGAPLATVQELTRRLRGQRIGSNLTINIQNNISSSDPLDLDCFDVAPNVTVNVVGARTTVLSTQILVAAQQRNYVINPPIPNVGMFGNFVPGDVDLTPYIPSIDGGFLVCITGTNNKCYVKNAVGGGAYDITSIYDAIAHTEALVAGGAVTVQHCPKIGCYSIKPLSGNWIFSSIYFNQGGTDRMGGTTYAPSEIGANNPGSATCIFRDCSFDMVNPRDPGMVFENCLDIGTGSTFSCDKTTWNAGMFYSFPMFGVLLLGFLTVDYGATLITNYGTALAGSNLLVRPEGLYYSFDSAIQPAANANDVCVIEPHGKVKGLIFNGTNAAGHYGLRMYPGARYTFTNKPGFNRGLGAGFEVWLGGLDLLWTDIPDLSGYTNEQNHTDIVPTGGSYNWLAQATWFVDNTKSNENSGIDAAHAIKTDGERQRRWGKSATLNQATTITYVNTPADIVNYDVEFGPAGGLTINGTETVVKSSTLAAANALNRGAQTPWDATSTVAFDGTEVGKFIKITGGANIGAYAGVVKNNGAGSLRLTTPGIYNPATFAFARKVLAAPDPYSIVTLTHLDIGGWKFRSLDNSSFKTVKLNFLELHGNGNGNIQHHNVPVLPNVCIFSSVHWYGVNGIMCLAGNCLWSSSNIFNGELATFLGGGMLNAANLVLAVGSEISLDYDFILQNAGIGIFGSTLKTGYVCGFDKGATPVFSCQCEGSIISLAINDGADLTWGTSNVGYAIKIREGGYMCYTTKPTINGGLGAGRETLIGAADTQWGAVPFADSGAAGSQCAIVVRT